MLNAEPARRPSHGRLPALPGITEIVSGLRIIYMVHPCIMGTVGHAVERWAGAHPAFWVPQVQAENVQQAESLVRLTEKVESLNGDIEDTQQLIGALHGASVLQYLLAAMLRPVVCKARSFPTFAAIYIHSNQPFFTEA